MTTGWHESRGTRHERGYGSAWEKLRATVLQRDAFLCQPCKARGRLAKAHAVDHIVNKAQGGTDRLDNLQSICNPCHKAKTMAESNGIAVAQGCDASGRPSDPSHHWYSV